MSDVYTVENTTTDVAGDSSATVSKTDVENSSAAITTDVTHYKKFGAIVSFEGEDGVLSYKAVGVSKDKDGNIKHSGNPSNLAETKDNKGWKEAEANGATVLTENDVRTYSLTDLSGFDDLVPSKEQQLIIVNRGLNAVQANAIAGLLNKWDEEKNEFVYNGVTIDLREALNEPSKRQSLSQEQKIMRDLGALDPTKRDEFIKLLLQMQASAS